MVDIYVEKLLEYGLTRGFFGPRDTRYVRNRILEVLRYPDYPGIPGGVSLDQGLEEILAEIMKWAEGRGLIPVNSLLYRDLLDAALMGALLPRPSEVREAFARLYRKSPEEATGYLYRFSLDANYIRKSRTDKNVTWKHRCEYGELEITINLSKPEKTVQEIEAGRKAPQKGYPPCLLCAENEGYGGSPNHPARQNLRLVPLELGGEPWYFQYSPYLYYNEHCILLNEAHTPMAINGRTLEKMLDFLDLFPHYFVGSNADLPVVGGSILSHDHFQGGRHEFPMEGARVLKEYSLAGRGEVRGFLLKWPLSALRLTGRDKRALLQAGAQVLKEWRGYRDEGGGIIPFSGEEPHNTATLIARMKEGCYQLDLVLRNNRKDGNHPEGIFHPHREVHNIKQENIGLIEAMGLAVLPGRLLWEMELMKRHLLGEEVGPEEREALEKHLELCREIRARHPALAEDSLEGILRQGVGEKFVLALEHAGVFKGDARGQQAFGAFIRHLGWQEVPVK